VSTIASEHHRFGFILTRGVLTTPENATFTAIF